jgi:hypothetical protein
MNAYNFFKFLEKTDGRKVPLLVKIQVAPKTITPEDLHVKDDFTLEHYGENPINLPDNMIIDGNTVIGEANLSNGLPRGLVIGGDLEIENYYLSELPSDIKVGGDVYIQTESEGLMDNYETPRAVKKA